MHRGLQQGCKVTWALGKVIFPVTLIVSILQHTPILPWIIRLLSPAMGLIGLPGEAAVSFRATQLWKIRLSLYRLAIQSGRCC